MADDELGRDAPFSERQIMQSVCSSLSEGVIAVNLRVEVIFMNPAAERITGVTRIEAQGKPFREVIREEGCGTVCSMKETLDQGRPVIDRSLRLVRRDGREVPLSISTALITDEAGLTVGAVQTLRDLSTVDALRRELEGSFSFHDIVGKSRAMRSLIETLPAIARSDAMALIQGESGTGKELVARALHHESARSKGPLVTVNCGALPDTLLESELFGHEAGAFTDARAARRGQVALAHEGTLFLDEIGETSPAVQVKLLRLLQEKTYQPLGAERPETADVRFIAATNRVLSEEVARGAFREDLFYRLKVMPITVPPLRDRREDIPLLAEHFVKRFNRLKNRTVRGLSSAALQRFMEHDFPGNVRELENAIEHAFVLCEGELLDEAHLPAELAAAGPVSKVRKRGGLKDAEARYLIRVLEEHNYSRRETARALDIHPTTLYRKIKALGIDTEGRDGRNK